MPHVDPGDWTPEHEARLRAALLAEADKVQTDPGALGEIRRRTEKWPFWRSPVVAGLTGATALVGAMVVGTVMVLNQPGGDPTAGRGGDPSVVEPSEPGSDVEASGGLDEQPSPRSDDSAGTQDTPGDGPPRPGDSSAPGESRATFAGTMPVYYAAPTASGELRLTREFHHIETDDDPVKAAVGQMFAPPADPDYVSLWAPTDVVSVDVTDDAIVIDLAEVPTVEAPNPDQPVTEAAVQQLVYTATAAASTLNQTDGSKPVRVLVAGERPSALQPVGLHLDLSRQSQIEVRQLVQLNDPAQGAQVTSPVAVTGEAAAFEAALEWEIRKASDEVVTAGTTQAEVCCEFSEFRFSVELEPGIYTVTVSDTDPSGGEGPGPATDTKTFEVVDASAPASPSDPSTPTKAPTTTGTPD